MVPAKNDLIEDPADLCSYWQQQLSGSSPLLDLPIDKPRRSSRNFETKTQDIFLSAQLVNSLKVISQEQDLDLLVILLAVFKVLIYRYTDRADVLIGSPIINQDRSSIDESISTYFNQIVLRTDLSGNPTFLEVLQRTNQIFTEAWKHQNLPFEQVLKSLNIERCPSYHPLFQVMFSLEQGQSDLTISPVKAKTEGLDRSTETSSIDLALRLVQTETGISGYFEYCQDLFAVATIERMSMHFQTLLAGVVANPAQSIDRLPLLTDAERHQLLVEWNQTQADYPNCCIHQLFEAQVERTPDRIALVFEDQQLTYRELNNQANQVARYLQARGVSAGMLVGLYVERSLSMMVGLFGILKTGAAYVPIDPNNPLDRIEYVLDNAQIAILLTQQQLIDHLPTRSSSIQLICLDTDWVKISAQSTVTPLVEITPDHLAYLIYTSGSTGQPKGVEALHRGVVNFIVSMQRQPGITATDILLSVTTLSFDMAVLEIFLPISVGAKLVLVSSEDAMDGYKLSAIIDRLGITIMQATPATWRLLLETQWPSTANPETLLKPQLKILTGAEPISIELVTKLLSKGASVWNLYGPTEATVWSTAYQVSGDESRVLIGKPIANTEIYILDAHLQPVPIGITGELYIGGAGLARGYWQKTDLTAEKFIPHPFNDNPAARIYKTGDLARYLPNGEIECLGRIDFQVKLRGFRIELGEIETLLCQHPQIAQAIAIIREDKTDDRRLVAYLITTTVAKQQTAIHPSISQLREIIANKLPSYMVPAAFVFLDTFPLTPNGKVNRSALPAPSNIRQLDNTFVAFQDDLELQLSKMWEQMLGIETIGIKDNFFELGGYSLLAVRLIADIERVWHRKLPLATFIAAPTIEQFAAVLRQEQASATWLSLVPIDPSGSKTPLFCIHPVGGNVLEYYPFAELLGAEQPIYGLQSRGLDGVQPPLTQIEDMAAQYIKEIQTVQPNAPYLLMGYSFGGLLAFEIACQLESQGKQVQLLALLDNESPSLVKIRPSLWQTLGIHFRNLRQLNIKEQVQYVKDRIIFRTLYNNKENGEKEFLLDCWAESLPPEYIQVLDANFQAGKNYPGKFYAGKVTLFRSSIQPAAQALHPDLGWGDLVGDIEIHDLPGYHSNLLKEPNLLLLAQQLKLSITRLTVDS